MISQTTKVLQYKNILKTSHSVIISGKFAQSLVDKAGSGTYKTFPGKMQVGQLVSRLGATHPTDAGRLAPLVTATNGLTIEANGVLSDADVVTNNPGIDVCVGIISDLNAECTIVDYFVHAIVLGSKLVGFEAGAMDAVPQITVIPE